MNDVRIKMADLKVKAAGPDDGLPDGSFEAYASVFGNVDSYGDIVDKGAFTRTLGEWGDKGDTIPILWGHDLYDPFANIGGVVSAEEDDHGLKVIGQLDLENPTAAQVYRLIKGRRTSKMSFAYAVRDAAEGDDGYHLKDLDLFEVSVVQIPANDQADILAVKTATASLVKAGRVLSSKNETALREARDAIDAVLSALDSESEDGKSQQQASGKTAAKPDASTEEPPVAKVSVSREEPKSVPSVDALDDAEWTFNTFELAYGSAGKD